MSEVCLSSIWCVEPNNPQEVKALAELALTKPEAAAYEPWLEGRKERGKEYYVSKKVAQWMIQ